MVVLGRTNARSRSRARVLARPHAVLFSFIVPKIKCSLKRPRPSSTNTKPQVSSLCARPLATMHEPPQNLSKLLCVKTTTLYFLRPTPLLIYTSGSSTSLLPSTSTSFLGFFSPTNHAETTSVSIHLVEEGEGEERSRSSCLGSRHASGSSSSSEGEEAEEGESVKRNSTAEMAPWEKYREG